MRMHRAYLQLPDMSISISNSQLENRIDKAIKKLPYKQSKVDFVATGIDAYIEALIKDKVLKKVPFHNL